MNLIKNLCASICVNILILGFFLLMFRQLDVLSQLLFSFAPIVLSVIVAILINRENIPEANNQLQCAAIYAAGNFIYLIIEYVCISTVADVNDIYKVSQKYNSGYVTVSENNSPILSIIIFAVVSFVIHYFAIKKMSAKREAV